MRGLTIIVATAEQTRFRSALGIALSHSALGGAVRLFLDTDAVDMVRMPIIGRDDTRQAQAGMSTLAELVNEALAAQVAIILCQAGMAMAGIETSDVDPRIAFGGLVSLLAELGDDRLAMA